MSINNKAIKTSTYSERWLIIWSSIKKNRMLYLLFLPTFLYYAVFRYIPMVDAVTLSLTKFRLGDTNIFASEWVGFENYMRFFNSIFFWRLLRNTLMINVYYLSFGFLAPIILALLLNEVNNAKYKRIVQTVSYLPNFISIVVVASMVVTFLSPSLGIVNNIIASLGGERISFLTEPKYFWGIYTSMTVWQTTGYNAIIYLAALTGIDETLYEASEIDGAGRWRQTWHITLPGIRATIVVLFLMKLGMMMNVAYEGIILLYNSRIYETADIFTTYTYRKGLLETDYSFASAVGIIQAVIQLLMVVVANKITKKYTDSSLW